MDILKITKIKIIGIDEVEEYKNSSGIFVVIKSTSIGSDYINNLEKIIINNLNNIENADLYISSIEEKEYIYKHHMNYFEKINSTVFLGSFIKGLEDLGIQRIEDASALYKIFKSIQNLSYLIDSRYIRDYHIDYTNNILHIQKYGKLEIITYNIDNISSNNICDRILEVV